MEGEGFLAGMNQRAVLTRQRKLGAYARFGPQESRILLEVAQLIVADAKRRISPTYLLRVQQLMDNAMLTRGGNGVLEKPFDMGKGCFGGA